MRDAPGRALIGFDGSDDARRAIDVAATIVGGVPAIVLTAWEPSAMLLSPVNPIGEAVGSASGMFRDFDEAAADLATKRADEGAALAAAAGFDPEPRVARGQPWRVILDAADTENVRVVVLGARGLGAVQSVLMGSTSAAVLHHARVPVLVVPPTSDGADSR